MKGRHVITLRVDKEMAKFLRKQAYENNISINQVINYRLDLYKKKCENVLTNDDGMIS